MLTHQPTVKNSKSLPKALCRMTTFAVMAGLAVTASLASHAASGELLDIELPSMRTPVEAVQASGTSAMATAPTGSATSTALSDPLTRAHVHESLAMARLANLVTPVGEMGDTADVLQAREDFNALQTEVMRAEYRTATLQLQQAQMDALVAQAEGYASTAGAAGAAETLQPESAATEQTIEVVVLSSDKVYERLLEGGDVADVTRAKGPNEVEAGATAAPVAVLLLVNDSAAAEPGK